jgi:hypothetical protein
MRTNPELDTAGILGSTPGRSGGSRKKVGDSALERSSRYAHLTDRGQAGAAVVIADERCDWVGMGVAEKLVREGRWVRVCVMGILRARNSKP